MMLLANYALNRYGRAEFMYKTANSAISSIDHHGSKTTSNNRHLLSCAEDSVGRTDSPFSDVTQDYSDTLNSMCIGDVIHDRGSNSSFEAMADPCNPWALELKELERKKFNKRIHQETLNTLRERNQGDVKLTQSTRSNFHFDDNATDDLKIIQNCRFGEVGQRNSGLAGGNGKHDKCQFPKKIIEEDVYGNRDANWRLHGATLAKDLRWEMNENEGGKGDTGNQDSNLFDLVSKKASEELQRELFGMGEEGALHECYNSTNFDVSYFDSEKYTHELCEDDDDWVSVGDSKNTAQEKKTSRFKKLKMRVSGWLSKKFKFGKKIPKEYCLTVIL